MKKHLLILSLVLSLGLLFAQRSPWNAPGDTLTVIQKPLLNIPAINIPGETLNITCLAPQSTTGFNAWIRHDAKRIALPLQSATWQTNPNRWELQVTIPNVPVFELYDLEVNANGGIHDISENAVQIIPSRKQSYYFVHITDIHLPNDVFYPNAGYDTDSTSVNDFRAVIEDINLIHPEFVLLTGDLINEGELEGLAGQYWYGWSQRLLTLFDIPVFLTAGNHDIGGWNSTPGPQGVARRNWWKYFGWSWLYNTNPNWNPHTQDYYFTYNNVLYIGLESYDNYDSWLSNIYGDQSYTNQQMTWLNNTVDQFPDYAKVLFHHYDFSDQLDLNALDIDISLWGHIHYNSGSLYNQPYSLATRSVCDGNRSYRVVKVNGQQFTPYATSYAGSSGTGIYHFFLPSNTGVADSVVAMVTNNLAIGFDNALIKFIMPAGNTGYTVTNGVLEQVDRSGAKNVCYVRCNITANSCINVSIKATGVANDDPLAPEVTPAFNGCYPNPAKDCTTLEISSPKNLAGTRVQLYNIRGQMVQEVPISAIHSGVNSISLNLLPSLGSGIYFVRLNDYNLKPYKIVITP